MSEPTIEKHFNSFLGMYRWYVVTDAGRVGYDSQEAAERGIEKGTYVHLANPA